MKKRERLLTLKNIAAAIIAILILYCLTTSKQVTVRDNITEDVNKPIVTSYPYEVNEEYDMKVPLGKKMCAPRGMNYTTEIMPKTFGDDGNSIICEMKLTNLENVSGTWIYDAYLTTDKGNVETPEIIKEVGPYATETFRWQIQFMSGTNVFGCNIMVLQKASMEKCFYPEPITYKIVKGTRKVTRYRNETTYEIAKVTSEKIVNKSVNRIFSYTQPNFGW